MKFFTYVQMSGFHALIQAQHRLERERLQRVSSTLKCPSCSQRFGNPGALASHRKFAHTKASQRNKLKFPVQAPPKAEAPILKRKQPDQVAPPSEEKEEVRPVAKKKKTRTRFRNFKKLALIREFKELRKAQPAFYRDEWEISHPTVSLRTLEGWLHPGKLSEIEHDALHPNPRVRNAFVSSKRLDFLNQGKFPEHEERLYEMFLERRDALKVVPRSWFSAKMKGLLRKNPPEGDGWKKFQASTGWATKFLDRFDVSRRARSNGNPKSVQQRLPQIRKFHKTAKAFTQPPPLRDAKYGRFPASTRYHVDQVPFEPARRIFDHTYEKKGAKRVQVAKPKVDLGKRQCTLQLTFCSGEQKVNPGICFRAAPKKLKKRADGTFEVDPLRAESESVRKELAKMPKDVTVYYQKKAWFDTSTCMAYARKFRASTGVQDEKLVGLDNLSAHCTPRFKHYMKIHANTLLLFTPDNCTDVCAVTDAGAS